MLELDDLNNKNTYTEDNFEALLVSQNLLHNLACLIILLYPKHENVKDTTDCLLILDTRVLTLGGVQVHP